MVEIRKGSSAPARPLTGLVVAGVLALGLSVGMTSAAWVDDAGFSASAAGSTFDIQARTSAIVPWRDVGLPGDPDTFESPNEIKFLPVVDALPAHSYVGDVYLCNAGEIDGRITDATLEAVNRGRDGVLLPGGLGLIVPGSIAVDGINVGTVIPANSCENVVDPLNDVAGIVHFTTVDDFTGLYGSTSEILIRIWVTSEP